MDRRTHTLALAIALLWASGCAAPFGKRADEPAPQSEQTSSDADTPAQTAAAVEETLKRSTTPSVAQAEEPIADADAVAQASTESTDTDFQSPNAQTERRTAQLAKRGGSPQPAQEEARDPAVDRQTLLDVIAEMEAAGVLDAKARGQLLDDLKQTDPTLWPQLIAYFQASLSRESRASKSVVRRAAAAVAEKPEVGDEVVISDSQELPAAVNRRPAVEPKPEPEAAAGTASAAPPKTPPVAAVAAAAPIADAKVPAAAEPEKTVASNNADWREHLAVAIRRLEQETTASPQSSAAVGKHAALRLLYLADGRRDDAVRPIAGVPAAQQDFWSKEMFGLATYLDAERNSDTSRRAAEAGVHLQGAAQRLAELATLQVKNLSFCTEVSSFGVYKKFAQYEFQAGQEVLLYAEVENFRSEQTDKGFHTALKASYQILDSHGARVAEHEFKLTEEYCQNARRDYFTNYFVWLPKRIYGGAYTLQLTLEDVKGQKIGQSSVDFTIKEKP